MYKLSVPYLIILFSNACFDTLCEIKSSLLDIFPLYSHLVIKTRIVLQILCFKTWESALLHSLTNFLKDDQFITQ